MNYPQKIINFILDTVFPTRCIGCGKFLKIEEGCVCRICLNALPINMSFECIGCKRSVTHGNTCLACTEMNCLDQLFIASDYKNPLIVRMIKTFKYRFISSLDSNFLYIISKYLKKNYQTKKINIFTNSPIIVPVPMSQKRINWRGYNQSELIANQLADKFQVDLINDLLIKKISTKSQADIKEKEERLQNIANCFRVNDKYKIGGRNILLVDDICTTGATLNECVKALKQKGILKVSALVIARG